MPPPSSDPLRDCSLAPDGSLLVGTRMLEGVCDRRAFLGAGIRFGGLGLASALGLSPLRMQGREAEGPLAPKAPHFAPKAKAVIQIFANGGPSQVDSWDPKPELLKRDGQKIPAYPGVALGSQFKFAPQGNCGTPVSEIFPELGKLVDDMAVIRSLTAEIPDHAIAAKALMTGSTQLPRPSVGAWVTYGLGTVNQNLPGFITLGGNPVHRQAAFFPGLYGGCNVEYSPDMPLAEVLSNISSQVSSPERQRAQIDFARQLNRMEAEALQRDIQLETRIQAFEIAYTMQKAAMDAFDISKETAAIREMYRFGQKGKSGKSMGPKLMVARRLVERGVRYVQITHNGWDHHQDIHDSMRNSAAEIDGPAAGLLRDLKERGLLDSTLVVWGGEIGRTVSVVGSTGKNPGRDHNGQAVCCWMAGGGIKGGIVYGATDEFGGRAVENKMQVRDLHATMLSLLGLDHRRLTFNYNGRDFRLTDNGGEVVKALLA